MQTDRKSKLEAELELSLLQIKQLQEELEHCYLECGRLEEQMAEYSSSQELLNTQELLNEGRVNDSRYSESGFHAKSTSLLSQVSQLKQALESSRSEKVKLEKQVSDGHQESKKRVEKLQCQVEQLAADLKESSRSVVSGQKKLTKFQADLGHLRDSYAKKVASEQELVELVNELREKLTLASRYYFDLQKEHPELLMPIENT